MHRVFAFFVIQTLLFASLNAHAADPFCQNDKGIKEIRDYLLCQNNPRLDACFNLSAQFYANIRKGVTAGVMTTGGLLATRASADYYLRTNRVTTYTQLTESLVAKATRGPTNILTAEQARNEANRIRRTGKTDALTQAMIRTLEEARPTNAGQIRAPILVQDRSGTYFDIANDTRARARIAQALTAQGRSEILNGIRPSFTEALRSAFGSDRAIYVNSRGTGNVARSLEQTFALEFLDKLGPAYTAPERAVGRSLAQGAARTIGPRSALLLGGFVGAGVFALSELASGSPTACATIADGYINREASNCKNVYEVNQQVANFLSAPSSKQLEIMKQQGSVCAYYKEFHAQIFPPFRANSLTCRPRVGGLLLNVNDSGQSMAYDVRYFENGSIRSIMIRKNGTPQGTPILFDQNLNPTTGLNSYSAANYRRAKLLIPGAAACCAQDAAGRNQCRADFNSGTGGGGRPAPTSRDNFTTPRTR